MAHKDVFFDRLGLYGPDLTTWPPHERRWAEALCRQVPELADALAQEARFLDALKAVPVPPPSEGFEARVQAVSRLPQRRPAARARHTLWWPRVAFGALAVLGFVLGYTYAGTPPADVVAFLFLTRGGVL